MKKYYGPIVLGIAALTVAAPIVNTTTVLAGTDDATAKVTAGDDQQAVKEDDTTNYTGDLNYTVDGDTATQLTAKDVTVAIPNNSKVGDKVEVDAPLIKGLLKNTSKIQATVAEDNKVTFDSAILPDYSDMVTGKVTFTTNLTDISAPVVSSADISVKNGESKDVKVPEVKDYSTTQETVKVKGAIDDNGVGTLTSEKITYIKDSDDTSKDNVSGTVTVTGLINGTEQPVKIGVNGKKGSTVEVDVPKVNEKIPDIPSILVKISDDGKTFTTGYKNKNGDFESSDSIIVTYSDHIGSITFDLPNNKTEIRSFSYNNNTRTLNLPLPTLPNNYYWVDKNGKKITMLEVNIKDGKLVYDTPTFKKSTTNNHSNHHSNNSTTKPTIKPETKPEPTKSIRSYQATFYALPNKITSLYNENGQVLKDRALSGNSSWLADKLMTLDGVNYLRVATDEWAKLADGLEVNPLSENIYTKNEARLYTANGDIVRSRALAGNTAWHTDKSATINGQTMYRVATNEWVSSADLK